MIIYLATPLRDPARARVLVEGIRTPHPQAEVRCLAVRCAGVPLHLLSPETLAALRRFVLAGTGPASEGGFGPRPVRDRLPILARRLPAIPRVTEVWCAVPEDTPAVAADLAEARSLGIPVRVLLAAELAEFARVGREALAPKARPVTDAEVAAALADPDTDSPSDRPDFRSPIEVLATYFRGMAATLGAPALAYDRTPGDGNAWGVQQRMVRASLRVAAAGAIMARARTDQRWQPEFLPLLRALHDDCGVRRAGVAAMGFEDDEAGRKRAERARDTAFRLIREAMRERADRGGEGRAGGAP